MWAVGDDAERDKRARCRGVEAALDGPGESFRVGDHVVGGGEQNKRVGVATRRNECGNARRRCGVPANGLQNEVINRYADLLKLFGNRESDTVDWKEWRARRRLGRRACGRSVEIETRGR